MPFRRILAINCGYLLLATDNTTATALTYFTATEQPIAVGPVLLPR